MSPDPNDPYGYKVLLGDMGTQLEKIAQLEREREADHAAIRALTADHVNRPHHLNACPMCIEHALAIQRATQALGEGTK